MTTPVTSVRAGSQNLAMTGGGRGGIVLMTTNFQTFTDSDYTGPAITIRSLTNEGVQKSSLVLLNNPSSGVIAPPIGLPLDFVKIGNLYYVYEFNVTGPGDDVGNVAGTLSLLRLSGTSFSDPTVIPLDLSGSSLASLILSALLFASVFTGFLPESTDGVDVILPDIFNPDVGSGELNLKRFPTTGGAATATYHISNPDAQNFFYWVMDSDNASLWLFGVNGPVVYHGTLGDLPGTEAFEFFDDYGSLTAAFSAAVDFSDGMLYVLWHNSDSFPSTPRNFIDKIDRDLGRVATYVLGGESIPIILAADKGILYVSGAFSDETGGVFDAMWKIDTATGEGTDEFVFTATGDSLASPGGDIVTAMVVGGSNAGGPNVLRQTGDVRVAGGLGIQHVTGDTSTNVLGHI